MAQQPKPVSEKLLPAEIIDSGNSNTADNIPDSSNVHPGHCSLDPLVTLGKPKAHRKLPMFEDMEVPAPSNFEAPLYKTFLRSQLSPDSFSLSQNERQVTQNVYFDLFTYVTERHYFVQSNESICIPSMKVKFALEQEVHTEQSKISYLNILNEKADSSSTIKKVLDILYKTFEINKTTNHLVVAGDAATIWLLFHVKKEYGECLDWVIPYLGDWHVLKNFQVVIMKIFWDGGLKT